MSKNLYKANSQWSTRPADQRFWTIEEAHAFTAGYAATAQERTIDFGVESIMYEGDGNLSITTDGGKGS